MALDLYVNFERYSNNSVFYRVVPPALSASYVANPFKLQVVDDEVLEAMAIDYGADYSINNGPYAAMGVGEYGEILENLQFDTSTTPCICAVSVRVYKGSNNVVAMFSMSGIFLSSLPTVDFIAYPEKYIDEPSGQMINLTKQTYKSSPGLFFYGEGHTELIRLSCTSNILISSAPNASVTWFIGNSSNSGFMQSDIEVYPDGGDYKTSFTAITSTLDDDRTYPISVKLCTPSILLNGPSITYDDVTGIPSYYPFFASSLNLSGEDIKEKFKSNIKVLPYPNLNIPTLAEPFSASNTFLPLDHSWRSFRATIYNPRSLSFLTERFIGTTWELQGMADNAEWSIATPMLSSILGYQFKLAYDKEVNDYMLPSFMVSPVMNSSVVLSVTAYKDVRIDMFPYDWQVKRAEYVKTDKTLIGPMPFVKVFIPNYFYLRGQDVPITIVETITNPFRIESVIISSPYAVNSVVLSGEMLSATMQFNRTGVIDLEVTTNIVNPDNGIKQSTTIVTANMIEVKAAFDVVDETYFLTSLTPLNLTYDTQPRLSPNEWAIADNVNSIIEKLYVTVEDLDQYTKLYENVGGLYAWLGPVQRTNVTYDPELGEVIFPIYIWADLECSSENVEQFATWITFECKKYNKIRTWEYHYCDSSQEQTDPTCLQKHCLDWRWKSRKQGFGNVNVSWKMTTQNSQLAKRWTYEQCGIDSEILNCNRDTWKVGTIDPLWFPIPVSDNILRCSTVDVEYYPKTNHLVFAHPTEINLIDNGYNGNLLIRRGIADDTFAFQNIVGIGVTSEGRVVVLDNVLCRISVFDVLLSPASFNLFTFWGSYGNADNPRGFYKPQDIHIDKYDSIWIADTGNKRIKKLTMLGKAVLTIYHEKFDTEPPLSMCVDSKDNIHCLTDARVIVFDQYGDYLFEYKFPETIKNVKRINSSYNKEMVYITYERGVVKYFRTGVIAYYPIKDLVAADGYIIDNFISVSQDKYRNLYITVGDKILKVPDLQQIIESKAPLPVDLYWQLKDLLINKEEYVQPWVYLKSFHRLWDNIEMVRNSLTYKPTGCKSYKPPIHQKEDLVIGQNEIVTNAVINRLSEQLWANIATMFDYFNPECEK